MTEHMTNQELRDAITQTWEIWKSCPPRLEQALWEHLAKLLLAQGARATQFEIHPNIIEVEP